MSFERHRQLFRTLRFRLLVWNTCVVLLTGVAILIALREGVRLSLLREIDEILLEDLKEIGLAVSEARNQNDAPLREELDRKARGHVRHKWFARFLDAQGRTIWHSADAAPLQALPRVPGSVRPYTLGDYRVAEERLSRSVDGAAIVRVGESLELHHEAMRRIDWSVAVTVGLVLLIAPIVGFLLMLRATQPLAAINSTAARLRPDRIEERLPVRGTGDELDQLSRTINDLLDRIADYLRERRDFVANSAHELRSPLAAIRSTVEVALNSGRSLAEYEELLTGIIDECSSLETLVNQLLLLAETDADRLRVHGERVALDDVVRRSVDMFDAVAESRGIALSIEIAAPVEVDGNSLHLRQVVNNLIDNAIKFTLPGGKIVVEVVRSDPDWAVIRVRDTGTGIAPDDIQHLFERFFRGDRSRDRRGIQHGSGLGLSICQAVVRAHGGTIQVDSRLGDGTTFTVLLPCLPAAAADDAIAAGTVSTRAFSSGHSQTAK
jgi:two-component system, OmpR family, heavy metal sensor histidine kinase CusS